MISTSCMKLKQSYIFHKNANYIPSSSLLYKQKWFGRSLEERRPNYSFVVLPWKYKQSTSCFHRLQSFTAQKHWQTQVIAEFSCCPFLKLFLKYRSCMWDLAWSYSNAVIILNLFVTLPFSVSAGNRSRNAEMPYEKLCLVSLFWWEIEYSRNFLSDPFFIRFLACFLDNKVFPSLNHQVF